MFSILKLEEEYEKKTIDYYIDSDSYHYPNVFKHEQKDSVNSVIRKPKLLLCI